MGLGIYAQPYGTGESFGHVSDYNADPFVSWVAPDQSTGSANACAAAMAWTSYGTTGICDVVNGVPVVIAPTRIDALVFPAKGYFYGVVVYGIGNDDDLLTAPLQHILDLLSTRDLVK